MKNIIDLIRKDILLKVAFTFGILISIKSLALACDACKQQQPKLLQGITHGAGPTSSWDYIIVCIMVLITLYSFYALIKYLAKPDDPRHRDIKNIILNS
jgi:ABC-type nickel/cobalt efflux system permease component RcnA